MILRKKDAFLNTMIIWFFAYITLHLWWSARVFRFYTEVLALICIFAAVGIIFMVNLIKSDKGKKIMMVLLVSFLISTQVFLFFMGPPNETTVKTLNRYESIHQLSSWANENLPNDSVYVVPDVAVYSLYLNKPNLVYYNNGINYLASNKDNRSVYIFADTLHSWMTGPFLKGENGMIVIETKVPNGPVMVKININIGTELVKKIDYQNKSTAMILLAKNLTVT